MQSPWLLNTNPPPWSACRTAPKSGMARNREKEMSAYDSKYGPKYWRWGRKWHVGSTLCARPRNQASLNTLLLKSNEQLGDYREAVWVVWTGQPLRLKAHAHRQTCAIWGTLLNLSCKFQLVREIPGAPGIQKYSINANKWSCWGWRDSLPPVLVGEFSFCWVIYWLNLVTYWWVTFLPSKHLQQGEREINR